MEVAGHEMRGYQDRMIVAEGAAPALQRAGLDTVGHVLRRVGDHVAAWSRSTDTIRVDPVDGGSGTSFFVKRYHYSKPWRRVWGLFLGEFAGRDRARQEYDTLLALEQRGVPVVRAAAAGRRCRFGMLRSCFLVTESFDSAVPLTRLTWDWQGRPAERNALIAALARRVAHMHRMGVVHGRLSWRNVLVRVDRSGGYDVRFLDFAPSRKRRHSRSGPLLDLGALGSLARVSCTRSECGRFIRAYLGSTRLGPEGRKLLRSASRVAEASQEAETRRYRLERLFEPSASSRAANGAPGNRHPKP